jgi:hypothetical protein
MTAFFRFQPTTSKRTHGTGRAAAISQRPAHPNHPER